MGLEHAFGVETVVNKESGTTIAPIGSGVYRISTPHVELGEVSRLTRWCSAYLILDVK